MSGHSKWHQIKRKKEVADAQRGRAFTKLAQHIKQAARAGTNPATNAALAEAITRARQSNMPQENIERLLAESTPHTRQFVTYEVVGPGGAGIIITAATDNTNRTVAEVRSLLKKHGGTLGQPGSVMWRFTPQPPGYAPRYPQTMNPPHRRQLQALLTTLTNHPDVKRIDTDVAEIPNDYSRP